MRKVLALLSCLLLTTCGGFVYAQQLAPPGCHVDQEAAAKDLLENHGELLASGALISMINGHSGLHVLQVYVNPKTRAWTAVIIHPAAEGGFACQSASGTAWITLTPKQGQPV